MVWLMIWWLLVASSYGGGILHVFPGDWGEHRAGNQEFPVALPLL